MRLLIVLSMLLGGSTFAVTDNSKVSPEGRPPIVLYMFSVMILITVQVLLMIDLVAVMLS